MKLKLVSLFLSLLVVLGGPLTILAHGQEDTSGDDSTSQSTETENEQGSEEETSRAEKRAERLQEYKDRLEEKLSDAQEKRIAGLCKAAQTVVANMQKNLDKALEDRRTKFQRVSDKLNELVEKLEAADVDTAELESALAQIDTKADQVIAAIENYQTALNDLAEMDCESDPSGFKAALEAARSDRKTVVTLSQELKKYVQETLKPLLEQIKQNLTSSETSEESED